jgi:hypothetical protein
MFVPSNTPKYVCIECRTKIPIVDLEGIFYDELKAFFTNPEAIARHLLNAKSNLAEKEHLLQVQKGEIAKVREQMKQTHELYLARQISVEGFGDIYKPLEERLTGLQSELPKLEAEIDGLKINDLSADEVLSEANQLYARWPKLPTEDKRKIVEGILEKAVIGPGDEIELTLSHLPTSEEMVRSQQRLRALNSNGVPSFSPGLDRAAGLPWVMRPNNPQPQRGCINRREPFRVGDEVTSLILFPGGEVRDSSRRLLRWQGLAGKRSIGCAKDPVWSATDSV